MTDDKLAREVFNTAQSIAQYLGDNPYLTLYRRQVLLAARNANAVLCVELGLASPIQTNPVEKPA